MVESDPWGTSAAGLRACHGRMGLSVVTGLRCVKRWLLQAPRPLPCRQLQNPLGLYKGPGDPVSPYLRNMHRLSPSRMPRYMRGLSSQSTLPKAQLPNRQGCHVAHRESTSIVCLGLGFLWSSAVG